MKSYRTSSFWGGSLIFLFFSYIISVSSSGIGKCPKISQPPYFNISRLTGQWYEVERSFYLMEIASSCTYFNLTQNIKGGLDVNGSTLNRWTNKSTGIRGVAIPISEGSTIFRFRFKTQIPFPLAGLIPGAGIYYILYTDYDNAVVIWSCKSYALVHTDKIWILGRSRKIPAVIRFEIYDRIRAYNLDPERLIISKNNKC